MLIFHSYVSLPEGITYLGFVGWTTIAEAGAPSDRDQQVMAVMSFTQRVMMRAASSGSGSRWQGKFSPQGTNGGGM